MAIVAGSQYADGLDALHALAMGAPGDVRGMLISDDDAEGGHRWHSGTPAVA